MSENFTSRVGYLIRNFRIASDMTQKELADKCGLNGVLLNEIILLKWI